MNNNFMGPRLPPAPWERLDYSLKGPGFAAQQLPDGSTMTELSIGQPAYRIPLAPSIYQGITPWDMLTLSNVAMYGYDPLQEEVYQRANYAASERIARGLSPFWTPADGESGLNYTPRIRR